MNDLFGGVEDITQTFTAADLLANDSDPNGDPLTITEVVDAVGGTVVLDENGNVVFTPDPDFNGEASFSYTITDGKGGFDTATVTVDVAPVNDPPVVEIDRFTFATVEQVTSQFQHDISNFIDVLTDVQEGQQLGNEFINGAGPITLDDQDREVSVSLHTDGAGHHNVIGFYIINPDGSFGQPQLVFPDASVPPQQPGDTVSLGVLPAGTTFGLFMIQNAASNPLIQQVANGTAEFSFVQADGDPATLFDGAPPQLRVHAPDADPMSGTPIAAPIFHTAADSDATFNGQPINTLGLNSDGHQHVAAGVGTEPDRIAIGWEDLTGGGDRDYNDVILEVNVGEANVTQVNPANVGEGANLGISDVDSPNMTAAVFDIAEGFQSGDTLELGNGFTIAADGPLAGQVLDAQGDPTGISVVGGGFGGDASTPNGLSFTGAAPVAVYQAVLDSVTFVNESADPGIRTLNVTVTDDQGAVSNVGVQNLAIGAADTASAVAGSDDSDVMLGGAGNQLLFGDAGNDTIDGGAGNDLLFGGSGNDTLIGGSGNDLLHGGTGNDTLQGGANNDTYRYERGDGVDTIQDSGGSDTLVLGEGITASDLQITAQGQDIAITVKAADGSDGGDKIVIKSGMTNQGRVETLRLADGTVINLNLSSMAGSNGLTFGNSQLNQLQFWKSGAGEGVEAMAGQMAAALAAVAAGAVALNPEIATAAEAVAESTTIVDDMAMVQQSTVMTAGPNVLGGQIVADLAGPAPSGSEQIATLTHTATVADILSAEPAPIILPTPQPAVQVQQPAPAPDNPHPVVPAAPIVASASNLLAADKVKGADDQPVASFVPAAAQTILAADNPVVEDSPPTATDDTLAATEDTLLIFDIGMLLGNDTDPEGSGLTLSSVGSAVGGTVAIVDGKIAFTPDADFNGVAGFRYTIRDAGGNHVTANAIVNVAAVNDAPVTGNETLGGTEDTGLIIAPGLLLANDTDVDGDTLTVSAVGNAMGGSVALDGSGNVIFTPDANFHGTATFEYSASDGQGGAATGTVTVLVASVNDNPVAVDDTAAGVEDQTLLITATSLLANDSDVDGDELTVTAVGNAVGGSVVLDGNGDVVFTPDANFNGMASFQYTVADGQGGTRTAQAVVNVASVNDNPTAGAETFGGTEDTALSIAPALLLANDGDLDGDALVIHAVANAVGGSVAIDGSGNVIFTPVADFNGTASFEYTVSDGQGGFATATVNVVVAAVNDAPVVTSELISGAEDTVITLSAASLLANDTDVDGDTLGISAVANAVGGTVAIDGSGNIVFTPTPDYNGAATFDYAVSDGQGGLTWATAAVALASVNDAPVLGADSFGTAEDTPLLIPLGNLLDNDSDIDGNPLTVSGVGNAVGGTVAIVGGNVTFTPAANFNGTASFDYTVSDGYGGVTTQTATIAVSPVNDAPATATDSFTMNEDTSLSISVASLLANDSDVEGNALTVTGVSGAVNGTVSLSGGIVTFTPHGDFYGSAGFYYTVSDGNGGTTTAYAAVTVNDTYDAPPPSDGGGPGDGGWPDPGDGGNTGGPGDPDPGKPVLLDLNGNGLDLISVENSTAYFDITDDGHRDKMGWVGAEDGLLAYDHNQDGDISRRDEIAFVDYLPGARTDLEGLRAFDSNQDGFLDAQDAEWSKFGVWQDADQDGVTDEGEFRSLDLEGIVRIGLNSDWNSREQAGNIVFGETSYTRSDGTTGIAGDVMLNFQSGAPNAAPPPGIDAQLATLRALMSAFTAGTGQPGDPGSNDEMLALIAAAEQDERAAGGE